MARICGTEGIHVLLNNAGVAPKSTRINMVWIKIDQFVNLNWSICCNLSTKPDFHQSGDCRTDDQHFPNKCHWTTHVDQSEATTCCIDLDIVDPPNVEFKYSILLDHFCWPKWFAKCFASQLNFNLQALLPLLGQGAQSREQVANYHCELWIANYRCESLNGCSKGF